MSVLTISVPSLPSEMTHVITGSFKTTFSEILSAFVALFYLFLSGHNTLTEIMFLMVFIIFFLPLYHWIVSSMRMGILSVLFMALFLQARSMPGT